MKWTLFTEQSEWTDRVNGWTEEMNRRKWTVQMDRWTEWIWAKLSRECWSLRFTCWFLVPDLKLKNGTDLNSFEPKNTRNDLRWSKMIFQNNLQKWSRSLFWVRWDDQSDETQMIRTLAIYGMIESISQRNTFCQVGHRSAPFWSVPAELVQPLGTHTPARPA